jgi:hypothetical protein
MDSSLPIIMKDNFTKLALGFRCHVLCGLQSLVPKKFVWPSERPTGVCGDNVPWQRVGEERETHYAKPIQNAIGTAIFSDDVTADDVMIPFFRYEYFFHYDDDY